MMQRATYEASEQANLAFVDYACPGFSCKDGTSINDPFTGAVMGRTFRDHVWIATDGFSSGQLPTTNRINYLIDQNRITANVPPSDVLPKDPNGYPITNTGKLYLYARDAAVTSGKTTCAGDGANGCHISCTQPSGGWQGMYCATQTVKYWSCSDSYAVQTPSGWVPTRDVTMPYTSTSPKNYSNKTWDWPTVFGWNDPAYGNTGGSIYMCNSTINTCSGWVTSASTYRCRSAASYDCSYTITDPITNLTRTVAQTCSTCNEAMGAIWDYQLTQSNDCPRTPRSTRVSDTRVVWQSDLISGGCASATPPPPPSPPSCPGGQVFTGSTCACPSGTAWDGSSCVAPALPSPVGTAPTLSFSMGSLSRDSAYAGAAMGSLSSGAVTSATIVSGSLPPGLSLSYSGNVLTVSGTPSANGSYSYSVTVNYPAGVDGAGRSYPSGSTTGANTISINGCPAQTISWSSGAGSCSGSVGSSASVGQTPTINASSSSPAGLSGSNTLSCNATSGAWGSSSSSCVASAPPAPVLIDPIGWTFDIDYLDSSAWRIYTTTGYSNLIADPDASYNRALQYATSEDPNRTGTFFDVYNQSPICPSGYQVATTPDGLSYLQPYKCKAL